MGAGHSTNFEYALGTKSMRGGRPSSLRRRSLPVIIASSATFVGVLAGGSPVAADRGPTVLTSSYSGDFSVRPTTIVYTGDGSAYIGINDGRGYLAWKKWGRTTARAKASLWMNDCNPNCGDGTFRSYASTVILDRPRKGHFTRLRIRAPSAGDIFNVWKLEKEPALGYGWKNTSSTTT